jgi:hypothetical protein
MTKQDAIKNFFDSALKGESKTYNDHNWYVSGGKLKGYIEGQGSSKYPLLKKAVSDSTIAEVKAFQSRGRDSNGQLWAVGRYQIIPTTLKGIQKSLNLSDSLKFSQEVQDQMGYALMLERTNLKNYLTGAVEDNKENRQKASLDMAKIWSSIGVPYAVNGKSINQSYYSSDHASVKTEVIQDKLEELRKNLIGATEEKEKKKSKKSGLSFGFILLGIGLTIGGYFIYKNKKLLKL